MKVFDNICSKRNVSLDVMRGIQKCSSVEELNTKLEQLDTKSRNSIFLALIWQHKNNSGKKPQYIYMEDTYNLLIDTQYGKKALIIGNLMLYFPIALMSLILILVFIYVYILNR